MVGRPDNISVRTELRSLRLTRSDNYIKCNKKPVYPIVNLVNNKFSSFNTCRDFNTKK